MNTGLSDSYGHLSSIPSSHLRQEIKKKMVATETVRREKKTLICLKRPLGLLESEWAGDICLALAQLGS